MKSVKGVFRDHFVGTLFNARVIMNQRVNRAEREFFLNFRGIHRISLSEKALRGVKNHENLLALRSGIAVSIKKTQPVYSNIFPRFARGLLFPLRN